MKRIVADPRKCLACRTCEIACAMAHTEAEELVEAAAGGARPSVYVQSAQGLAVPLQCRHCEDAPCVRVCPTTALSRSGANEPVLVDQEKCIGCEFCVQACPFGVIRLAADRHVVIKCDLCVGRQADGLAPACVASCPSGALSFEDVGEGARQARAKTAAEAVALRVAERQT